MNINRASEVPLILGGHSFIAQLGNEPAASERQQRAIVESCLNRGIVWFDTTYQPERLALGRVLHDLGRRPEASILAWNFFTDFAPGEAVGGPDYFRPDHIDLMLEQLRTDYLDGLVLVLLDDPEQNRRQQELVIEWMRRGYVRSLGLWISDPAVIERCGLDDCFQFAVRPFNVTTDDAAAIFAQCRARGWETLATSPFFRGWELDRMVAEAVKRHCGEPDALRRRVADLMLRYTLFQPDVGRVVVAMRRPEWVERNLESVARGPLTDEELGWLRTLRAATAGNARWWRRLFRRR